MLFRDSMKAQLLFSVFFLFFSLASPTSVFIKLGMLAGTSLPISYSICLSPLSVNFLNLLMLSASVASRDSKFSSSPLASSKNKEIFL